MAKDTSRAGRLYRIALDNCNESVLSHGESAMLRALCHVIAEATKKNKAKTRWSFADRQYGEEVHTFLCLYAGDKMALKPAAPQTFGRIGQKLKESDITLGELKIFAEWLHDGGLDWMDSKPTWGQFCKYAVDWVAKAKAERHVVGQTPLEEYREGR